MSQLGKYTLLRRLAVGGMAEVHLARTEGPAGFTKTVVIKRILPTFAANEEFVSMFLNEARLAAMLNHPNLIQIFDLGLAAGSYYLAMEVVDGANLRELHRAARAQEAFLPVAAVLKVLALTCEGLDYAHNFVDESGRHLELIHRDVSPENLLLSRQGAVKVADFGIAKAASLPSITEIGIVKGKVNYMAPEQICSEPLDRRADVFALGVVLYEMLTGVRPYQGVNNVATISATLHDAHRPLAEHRADLPPELQAIVDRALAKQRAERYQSCRELQVDLQRVLAALKATVVGDDIAQIVKQYGPPTPLISSPNLASGAPEGTALDPAPTVAEAEQIHRESSDHTRREGVRRLSQAPEAVPLGGESRPISAAIPTVPENLELEGRFSSALTIEQDVPTSEVTAKAPARRGPGLRGWQRVGLGLSGVVGGMVLAAVVVRSRLIDPAGQDPSPAPVLAVGVTAAAPPLPPPAVEGRGADGSPRLQAPPSTQPPPSVEPPTPSRPAVEPPRTAAHSASFERRSPKESAESARASGSLEVRVSPWATVEVDGVPKGTTPLAAFKIAAGPHKVRLMNDTLSVDRVYPVNVRPGATKILGIKLQGSGGL